MTSAKTPITVVIPVKNEQANLAKCLQRLSNFEEVVVLDSDSDDDTVSIATAHGATCLNFKWDGKFPKKRNWYLLNFKPKCDWVLFLDADEFVSESFIAEAETAIKDIGVNGHWLNYTNYFLGRKLRFGVPQRKLALIRFGAGYFERIEEDSWSQLDMEIHEHPILDGNAGEIRATIEHNDDRGIEKFLVRHVQYAKWEVARSRRLQAGNENSALNLTKRQKIKYALLNSPLFPICYFIYQWIFKFGFLDGYAGLQYAFHKMWYFNLIGILSRSKGQ
ncbi:MAG: glycosyltransferase family 2 protein [Ignavibacteria bacterium]|nr:glycosyltransferase family 2 protein [Ignavibacteria bacterium]